MAPGCLSGRNNLFLDRLRASEFYVIFNTIPEQINLLKNHTYVFQKAAACEMAYIRATKSNCSAADIVKTANKWHNVDFPLPDAPTIAVVEFCGILKFNIQVS